MIGEMPTCIAKREVSLLIAIDMTPFFEWTSFGVLWLSLRGDECERSVGNERFG